MHLGIKVYPTISGFRGKIIGCDGGKNEAFYEVVSRSFCHYVSFWTSEFMVSANNGRVYFLFRYRHVFPVFIAHLAAASYDLCSPEPTRR